jgi:hypothetical protein
MWQSANYLNDAVTEIQPSSTEALSNGQPSGYEEPPSSFMKSDPDQDKRRRAWNLKSPEKRKDLRRQLEEHERTGRIVANDA